MTKRLLTTTALAVLAGAALPVLSEAATKKVPLPRARPAATAAATAASAVRPAALRAAAPAAGDQETTATAPAPAAQRATRSAQRAAIATTASTPSGDVAAVQSVIDQLREGSGEAATQTARGISDPVARKLAEWLILRSDVGKASAERYTAFLAANPSWPGLNLMRRKGEAALFDNDRDNATALAFFAQGAPLSAKGKFMLARALLAQGDRAGAEKLVRQAWRGSSFGRDTESWALEQFGPLLTGADHKIRMEYLLHEEENEAALRAAQRLGGASLALAKAWIAVNRKAGNAKALLDAVPAGLHQDTGYLFARAQWLRRADRVSEAAHLLQQAPRQASAYADPDEWWVERRLVARKLLDANEPRAAYAVARDAITPDKENYRIEQQFTAGWIALRFLNDPSTALTHFARIAEMTENPTSLARAGYWKGRALEAAGRSAEARAAYREAADYTTAYYGQLAAARAGVSEIGFSPKPARPSAPFEVARAAEILYALDERELLMPMLTDLGERGDEAALSAVADLAARQQDARGVLQVGKGALNRGLPFDLYAYPTYGIPRFTKIGPEIETPVIHAIARQESAFNPRVVSPANAYGLMQVTAGAARDVAKKFGATYNAAQLKQEPAYNVQIGAAELGALVQDFRGSYILTFAAYNAGRSRIREWIQKYGDPRDPSVDPVDWVERIPFAETRNYVQRIMENLQVYRALLTDDARLRIQADMKRGAMTEASASADN